jgi:hypothetical protein
MTINKDTINKDTINKDTINKDTINKDIIYKYIIHTDTIHKNIINKTDDNNIQLGERIVNPSVNTIPTGVFIPDGVGSCEWTSLCRSPRRCRPVKNVKT